MTTFSQLIDDIVLETLRPDLLKQGVLPSYVNQTVRELHFKPSMNVPVLYEANRFEDVFTVTAAGTYFWPLPSATRFQDVEAIFIDDLGRYLQPRNPRIALAFSDRINATEYYYRSGATLAMFGLDAAFTGKISYFMYPRTLTYKSATVTPTRLIKFVPDTDSYDLISGGIPTESQLELETHWLLQRWSETIKEGTRAKVYKRLGDDTRARMCFSSFESLKDSLWLSEPSTE